MSRHLWAGLLAAGCGGAIGTLPVAPDVPTGAAAARDAELAKLAEHVVSAYTNEAGTLSHDGRHVAFVSKRDGVQQPYLADVDQPSAPPRRIVNGVERCEGPSFSLDDRALIFACDHGADENFSIFRAELAGGAPVELTPGPPAQRTGPWFPTSGAPDVMIWSSIPSSEVGSHIYSSSAVTATKPTLLYRDDLPGAPSAVSHDGKLALIAHLKSFSDNTIVVASLDGSNHARQLYPPEGKVAAIGSVELSADDRTAFIATDAGGDGMVVLAIDVASGAERARFSDARLPTASIAAMHAAQTGDLLAVTLDAGDHQEIRLLDPTTLKEKVSVDVPLGAGGITDVSVDGRWIVADWSTADHPTDLLLVDARTGKTTPLRDEPSPALAALGKVSSSLAKVASFDGTQVPAIVSLPVGAPGPLPVIVLVHGGPAASSTVGYQSWVRFYLAAGYAVVQPNVRGSTGFGRAYEMADNGHLRMNAVKDLEAVARWVQAQPWARKDQLIVVGGSYGGYMTLMALTHQTDLWRVGVDLAGISSWKSFMRTTTGVIRNIFLIEFGDPATDGPFLDSISPIHDVDKMVAPLFVYQGVNDPRVPKGEADQMVAAVRRRNIPVEYMVATNEGHSVDHKENLIAFLSRSARFIEDHLK